MNTLLGLSQAVLLAASLASAAVLAGGDDRVVVISDAPHATGELNHTFLQSVFTMRTRRWPDGTPVRVFVLPDNDPLHGRFCRQVLGTYPYVLRSLWDRLVFTGTGPAPTVVGSEQEMRRRVAETPGAIGYVGSNDHEPPVQVVPVRSGERG